MANALEVARAVAVAPQVCRGPTRGAMLGDGGVAPARRARHLLTGAPRQWARISDDIDGEAARDYSGRTVSLSADGTTLAVGATGNDGTGSNAGHVRVYELTGADTSWHSAARRKSPGIEPHRSKPVLQLDCKPRRRRATDRHQNIAQP